MGSVIEDMRPKTGEVIYLNNPTNTIILTLSDLMGFAREGRVRSIAVAAEIEHPDAPSGLMVMSGHQVLDGGSVYSLIGAVDVLKSDIKADEIEQYPDSRPYLNE